MEEKQGIVKHFIKRALRIILYIEGVIFNFFIPPFLIIIYACLEDDPKEVILLLALFCSAFIVGFIIELLIRKKARKS